MGASRPGCSGCRAWSARSAASARCSWMPTRRRCWSAGSCMACIGYRLRTPTAARSSKTRRTATEWSVPVWSHWNGRSLFVAQAWIPTCSGPPLSLRERRSRSCRRAWSGLKASANSSRRRASSARAASTSGWPSSASRRRTTGRVCPKPDLGLGRARDHRMVGLPFRHAAGLRQFSYRLSALVLRRGCPAGPIEAAACARPIVTTDTPGCREVVHMATTACWCRRGRQRLSRKPCEPWSATRGAGSRWAAGAAAGDRRVLARPRGRDDLGPVRTPSLPQPLIGLRSKATRDPADLTKG